jgi:Type IV secretory pathway, VirB11 components, and related ATPases involved in archaeal flagella biosynthesis
MKKIVAEDILKYFDNEIKNESFIPDIKSNIDKSKIDIIYPLIGKLAYAHIYYDNISEELVYELLEPEISDEERILIEKVKKYILDEMYKDPEEFLNKNKEYVLIKKLEEFVNIYKIKINRDIFIKYYYYLWRDMLGYEKIHPLFYDIFIEDISCDGYDIPIYVHHNKFGILRTNVILSRDELDKFIVKLAQKAGKHISYAEPILDATLEDGSRINATYSQEITTHGPTFTIRKFKKQMLSLVDLINQIC